MDLGRIDSEDRPSTMIPVDDSEDSRKANGFPNGKHGEENAVALHRKWNSFNDRSIEVSANGYDMHLQRTKQLELQLRALQVEIANLKRKVYLFEEESNRNRWAIRYSRRMAIMSNLLLGLWIFWSRFLKHVQRQKKTRLLGSIMGPGNFNLKSFLNKQPQQNQQHPLNKLLYEGYAKAISKSWVFFFGALMLTRNVSWKRHIGLSLTTSYSLYLAIFSQTLPWTNYFNMFANLLYLTSSVWNSPDPQPELFDATSLSKLL